MNIFTRYLNSAAVFYPEDTKTPVEIEREKIASTVTQMEKEDDPWKDNNKEEEKEEEENKEEESDDKEDDEEDKEGETDDQKKERIAAEKQARKDARMQKRIDTLTAQLDLTKKETDALKKQLEANPDKTLTAEEVQRQAKELAQQILNERNEQEGKAKFDEDCEKVEKAAKKADKDFIKNINEAASEVGPIPQPMIYLLVNELDYDNMGEVMAYLAKNVDEYEDIYNYSIPRMTRALNKISTKLHTEAEENKKNKKERSKVPPPVTPVKEGRGASSTTVLPAKPNENAESMEKFVRLRAEQDAARRKARGY